MIVVVPCEEKSGVLTATLEYVLNATGSSLVREVVLEGVEDLPQFFLGRQGGADY